MKPLEPSTNETRPRTLEILLSTDYLPQLTDPASTIAHEKPAQMAEGLFYELGIRTPEISYARRGDLPPQSFAFRLDERTSPPAQGLTSGQLLVNDTISRLSLLGISDGLPARNPANDNECAIIEERHRELAWNAGLTLWDPVEYLVLACAAMLRQNAAWLIDVDTVEYELARLQEQFPELAAAAAEKITVSQLTRILRNLLDEEISIRDLRTILERIVAYDEIVCDSWKFIVFDERQTIAPGPAAAGGDRIEERTQFARTGLKRYIGHKYTRGQSTLLVYLLDSDAESRLMAARASGDADGQTAAALRDAVREELGDLPPTAQMPVILTSAVFRAFLRRIVAAEFPRLAVLCYEELPPELNIQPLARLSLAGS